MIILCATKFNIQKFHVLSTVCIRVFYMVLKTHRNYFSAVLTH